MCLTGKTYFNSVTTSDTRRCVRCIWIQNIKKNNNLTWAKVDIGWSLSSFLKAMNFLLLILFAVFVPLFFHTVYCFVSCDMKIDTALFWLISNDNTQYEHFTLSEALKCGNRHLPYHCLATKCDIIFGREIFSQWKCDVLLYFLLCHCFVDYHYRA